MDAPQGTKTGGAGVNGSCPTLREQVTRNNFQTVTSQVTAPGGARWHMPTALELAPDQLWLLSGRKPVRSPPSKEVSAGPGPGGGRGALI